MMIPPSARTAASRRARARPRRWGRGRNERRRRVDVAASRAPRGAPAAARRRGAVAGAAARAADRAQPGSAQSASRRRTPGPRRSRRGIRASPRPGPRRLVQEVVGDLGAPLGREAPRGVGASASRPAWARSATASRSIPSIPESWSIGAALPQHQLQHGALIRGSRRWRSCRVTSVARGRMRKPRQAAAKVRHRMDWTANLPFKLTHGFDGAIGIELIEVTDELVRRAPRSATRSSSGRARPRRRLLVDRGVDRLARDLLRGQPRRPERAGNVEPDELLRPILEGTVHAAASDATAAARPGSGRSSSRTTRPSLRPDPHDDRGR